MVHIILIFNYDIILFVVMKKKLEYILLFFF